MALRTINVHQTRGYTKCTVTLPKDDLELDGYLALVESLADEGHSLKVHIQREAPGEWSLEIREDLLPDDVLAAADVDASQLSLDEIDVDAAAD